MTKTQTTVRLAPDLKRDLEAFALEREWSLSYALGKVARVGLDSLTAERGDSIQSPSLAVPQRSA